MKRLLLPLVAGALMVGLIAPSATADRTDKPQGTATSKEMEAFLRDLHRTRADLALAQSTIFGGQEWREETCRFQSLERPTWTQREEDLTAACVERELGPVEGGLSKLMAVGQCESHWNRVASNGGQYLGLFQHSASYWPGRVASLLPKGWRIGPWQRWQNSRSQVIVTVKMARYGWAEWSCA
jgi:hypothetical protein